MSQIWCNGEWLDGERYPGAAQDRGAFLGLGLFETMLALDGRLVFPQRHLKRFHASGRRLGWDLDLRALPEIAAELLVRNGLEHGTARVRLIATAGSGAHNDLAAGADRLIWLAAMPLPLSDAPVALGLSPWPRNERSPLAGLKTSCYAENLIALDEARKRGFDESLFLNTAGQICESATANVFLVNDGVISTPSPDSGCLPGIGREILMHLAESNGIELRHHPLPAGALEVADEIFLSSATRGPVRVGRFEGREFPATPVTARMQDLWQAEVRRAFAGGE